MATPDLPDLPGTHTWMAGGPLLGRAGQTPVYPSDDTVVWVWDADTGERVTDLLNESGNPVVAPEVRDGWVVGVGVPVAVKVASFSAGQFGKRQLMVPVQSFKDAASAIAPTDTQVATLMGNSGSASRTVTDGLYVAQSDLYTGGVVKASKLPDLSGTYAPRAGSWAGDSGRRYKPFLGVVRNDGSGWAFINDSGHRPTGFGAVTVLSDRLQIAYDASVLKVGSLQGVLDETLTAMGYRVGTSVGTGLVELYFYRQSPHYIADYVQYTGSAWSSFNGVFTGLSYNGAGVLTLTHEPMGTTGQQAIMATPRGTAAALAGAYADTTSQVTFYTGSWGSLTATGAASASQHRVYVVRYGQRAAVPKVDPSTVVAEFGNVWLMGAGETAA